MDSNKLNSVDAWWELLSEEQKRDVFDVYVWELKERMRVAMLNNEKPDDQDVMANSIANTIR